MDATHRRRLRRRSGLPTQSVVLAVIAGQSNVGGRDTVDAVEVGNADVYQFGGDPAVGARYQVITSDIAPARSSRFGQATGAGR